MNLARGRYLFPLLLLLPVVGLSSAEPTPPLDTSSHDHEIVWMEEKDPSQVMFIPESLLNEKELADFPLTEAQRSHLEGDLSRKEYIEAYRKRTGREHEPVCPIAILDPRWKTAQSLEGLLREEPLSFIAMVESVVPGYDFWRMSPVNMLYLKPETFLRGNFSSSHGAGRLLYSEGWGSIMVKNKPVCWQPPSGFYRARSGDRVLIVGRQLHSNPAVLDGAYIFPVIDGTVRPVPYPAVEDFKPTPIDTLRVQGEAQ